MQQWPGTQRAIISRFSWCAPYKALRGVNVVFLLTFPAHRAMTTLNKSMHIIYLCFASDYVVHSQIYSMCFCCKCGSISLHCLCYWKMLCNRCTDHSWFGFSYISEKLSGFHLLEGISAVSLPIVPRLPSCLNKVSHDIMLISQGDTHSFGVMLQVSVNEMNTFEALELIIRENGWVKEGLLETVSFLRCLLLRNCTGVQAAR